MRESYRILSQHSVDNFPRVGIASRCGNERASAAARDVLNARRAGTVVNGREAAVISARERSARAVPDDAGNCRTEC